MKRVRQHSAESRGFSPGVPVSSAQGKLTGWVRITSCLPMTTIKKAHAGAHLL